MGVGGAVSPVRARARPLPSSSAPRRPLVRLEPVEPRRRSRVSEIVVGVVVVAACGLGTVLWQASSSHRERVLVLAHAVKAGEPITSGDLTVGDVHLGTGVDAVPTDEAGRVLAHVAVADLPAGTLVAPALFVDRPALPTGARIVGIALAPAELPTFDLRPGQKVDVLGTARAVASASAAANPAAQAPTSDVLA